MVFSLFGHKKDARREEIDKKYQIAVAPSQELPPNSVSEDEKIDIILGENIKKSKFTQPMENLGSRDSNN